MHTLRPFSIIAWIALPTVMYGGYALLGMLTKQGGLIPFQETFFRAGVAQWLSILHSGLIKRKIFSFQTLFVKPLPADNF